jgi:RNase H-fold protein (predicted Holliday junction resolvase)
MGLAVGDDHTGVVSPLKVVRYDGVEVAANQIVEAASAVGATGIVLALPSLANGSTGASARRSQLLAEALQARGATVALQGEYLSSNEARRRARAAGRDPRRPVDDIAAQIVLEEYLCSRAQAPAAET